MLLFCVHLLSFAGFIVGSHEPHMSLKKTTSTKEYMDLMLFLDEIETWFKDLVQDLISENEIFGIKSEESAFVFYNSLALFIEFHLRNNANITLEKLRNKYDPELMVLTKSNLNVIHLYYFNILCQLLSIERSKKFYEIESSEINDINDVIRGEFKKKYNEMMNHAVINEREKNLQKNVSDTTIHETPSSLLEHKPTSKPKILQETPKNDLSENEKLFEPKYNATTHSEPASQPITNKLSEKNRFFDKIFDILLKNYPLAYRKLVLPITKNENNSSVPVEDSKLLKKQIIEALTNDYAYLSDFIKNNSFLITKNICFNGDYTPLLEYFVPNFIYITQNLIHFYVKKYSIEDQYLGFTDTKNVFLQYGQLFLIELLEDVYNLPLKRKNIDELKSQIPHTTNAMDILELCKKFLIPNTYPAGNNISQKTPCLLHNRFEETFGTSLRVGGNINDNPRLTDEISDFENREEGFMVGFSNDTLDATIYGENSYSLQPESEITFDALKEKNRGSKGLASYEILSYIYSALEGAFELAENFVFLRQNLVYSAPSEDYLAFRIIYRTYLNALQKKQYHFLDEKDDDHIEKDVKAMVFDHVESIFEIVFDKISTNYFLISLKQFTELPPIEEMFVGFNRKNVLINLGEIYSLSPINQYGKIFKTSKQKPTIPVEQSNSTMTNEERANFTIPDFFNLMHEGVYIGSDFRTSLNSIGYQVPIVHETKYHSKIIETLLHQTLLVDKKIKFMEISKDESVNFTNHDTTIDQELENFKRVVNNMDLHEAIFRSILPVIDEIFDSKEYSYAKFIEMISFIVAESALITNKNKESRNEQCNREKIKELLHPMFSLISSFKSYIENSYSFFQEGKIPPKEIREDFLKQIPQFKPYFQKFNHDHEFIDSTTEKSGEFEISLSTEGNNVTSNFTLDQKISEADINTLRKDREDVYNPIHDSHSIKKAENDVLLDDSSNLNYYSEDTFALDKPFLENQKQKKSLAPNEYTGSSNSSLMELLSGENSKKQKRQNQQKTKSSQILINSDEISTSEHEDIDMSQIYSSILENPALQQQENQPNKNNIGKFGAQFEGNVSGVSSLFMGLNTPQLYDIN